MARAGELGADQTLTFLREVDDINVRRRMRVVELARTLVSGSLLDKRITVLGAAFNPNSDDVRRSAALNIAAQLQGATVTVTERRCSKARDGVFLDGCLSRSSTWPWEMELQSPCSRSGRTTTT